MTTSAPRPARIRITDFQRLRTIAEAKRDYERALLKTRLEAIRLRRVIEECR